MIQLTKTGLTFAFPEVHPDARCTISFQRTLRIPDDNRSYSLPPGLGAFSMVRVQDLPDNAPAMYRNRGGVVLPMYQAEALWINFASDGYPFAVKIGAGKINAVTGSPWTNGLHSDPQDYLPVPSQPWLDGFCVAKGMVRQFVAMPLGSGYSAEEQITGSSSVGGIQIVVVPITKTVYERITRQRASCIEPMFMSTLIEKPQGQPMGLAPGGLINQKIYDDNHKIADYLENEAQRCFVHLVNSETWTSLTGQAMPTKPITSKQYTAAGLPWFDLYDEGKTAVGGSKTLANLKSLAAHHLAQTGTVLPDNDAVTPINVVKIPGDPTRVSDGDW